MKRIDETTVELNADEALANRLQDVLWAHGFNTDLTVQIIADTFNPEDFPAKLTEEFLEWISW